MQNTTETVADGVAGTVSIPLVDLCDAPDRITEQLQCTKQIVLTNNGDPVAVMLNVDNSTLKETLSDLRRMRAQRATKIMQEAAVKSGLSNLTLEEINAEITAARVERRARGKTR